MFKWLNKFRKQETVYCKDCKWCKPAMEFVHRTDIDYPIWYWAKCLSPKNVKVEKYRKNKDLILVANEEIKLTRKLECRCKYCFILRNSTMPDVCGPKGKWFEPKEEEMEIKE